MDNTELLTIDELEPKLVPQSAAGFLDISAELSLMYQHDHTWAGFLD